MINLCTLFDSNYLERGLVLYKSLKNCCKEFKLYIVALDENCYKVLQNYNLSNILVVKLEEIENDVLREVKKKRSYRAYCWTCSSWAIKYFIETYNLEICTYIDADEFFYASPQELLDDFTYSGCSVGIIKHNFGRKKYEERMSVNAGKYCVQFNSFKNDVTGMKILNEWCINCAEVCEEFSDGKRFGDQKYVEEWPEKYDNIYIYENIGAGVAPWNIYRFNKIEEDKNNVYLYDKVSKRKVKVYFAHFHNLVIGDKMADINAYTRYGIHSKKVVDFFYGSYIKQIIKARNELYCKFPELCLEIEGIKDVKQIDRKLLDKVKRKGIGLFIIEALKYRLLKKQDYFYID